MSLAAKVALAAIKGEKTRAELARKYNSDNENIYLSDRDCGLF